MKTLLTDCAQRLEWADQDGETLTANIAAFVETNPYGIWMETNGEEGTATFRRFVDPATEAEIFQGFSRLVGSFLDHSRAALNYLAYQIALLDAPAQPQLRPEAVEFPIFDDPEMFRRHNRVKQLTNEHRDLLESVQPYDGKYPGLWLLHELSREWRHRVIHPSRMASIDEAHAIVTGDGTRLLDFEVLHSGPLEDGDVVLRFTVTRDDGEPEVQPQVALSPSLDHPLCNGRGCVAVLNEITSDVGAAATVVADAIPEFA